MSSTPSQPGPELPPDFDMQLPQDLEVRRCYRHPDRETGVSCSNCGRPICHECMIPAPVGFRCPECVRQQNQGRAKVVTRGQMRTRWTGGFVGSGRAEATRALLIANVVVFVVELALGATSLLGYATARMVDMGGLVPALVAQQHEYWRLFTNMFLHFNVIHILFNMWALWVVGGYLEALVGRLRFLMIYFISGLAGSALVMVAAPAVLGDGRRKRGRLRALRRAGLLLVPVPRARPDGRGALPQHGLHHRAEPAVQLPRRGLVAGPHRRPDRRRRRHGRPPLHRRRASRADAGPTTRSPRSA